MMLPHFLEPELGSNVSIEIAAYRIGLQQLSRNPTRNIEILVNVAAMKFGFEDGRILLVANRPKLRRIDHLPQHGNLPLSPT
jgi:hypothetical protein